MPVEPHQCVRCGYPIFWKGACEVCAAFITDDGKPRPL